MPSSKIWLRRGIVAAAAGVAVAAAPGTSVVASPIAGSAATRIVLNLQGGYRNAKLVACHIRHHYTYYHPGHRIPFNGSVTRAPGKHFLVKVKVKKCVKGRFRTVVSLTAHVGGNKTTGHYDGSLRSPGGGSFFARAYYYGVPAGTRTVARSDKQYFRVQ